jgi:predicted Holliday junction resolvase-like endonuclease
MDENEDVDYQSEGLSEAMNHMKQTLHDLRLHDAIHRQEIRKMERDNGKMENKMAELKLTIANFEKQKSVDEQYLMKQQEIITKSEMAEEIDNALNDGQPSKLTKNVTIGKFPNFGFEFNKSNFPL